MRNFCRMHVINMGDVLPYRANVEFLFGKDRKQVQDAIQPYPGQLAGYSPTTAEVTTNKNHVLAGTKRD
jgi:hypothetical protein